MSGMNWRRHDDRRRMRRQGTEDVQEPWERRASKDELRALAAGAVEAFEQKGGKVKTSEAPIRTCTLPDPVAFDLVCEHCGRQATVTLPLARLSATLRCSGCGMVAMPF